jgi:two-component system chemotaxis response regulator CheB
MAGTSRTGQARKVRVLVVDDSAMVRAILRSALSQHPGIEVVGLATDGLDALAKIASLRPDVVTLDVEMPRLNGLGVLQRVSGKVPVSFVMISTLTQAGARVTFDALRLGAFDYVPKPERSGIAGVPDFRQAVQDKVLAAAAAKGRSKPIVSGRTRTAAPTLPPNQARGWIVAIGISCGGPQTLMEMLPAFPSDFVPIVVTQHMPAQFTATFASRLDKECAMRVKEAADGDVAEPGLILVAPGDRHLGLRRTGLNWRVALDSGPLVSGHRPSADFMFSSAARAGAPRCVGVIMTGMGHDGADGIVRLKTAGCPTIAQDEETSLVYGMPKAAVQTGHVDQVVPLPRIPHAIARVIGKGVCAEAQT